MKKKLITIMLILSMVIETSSIICIGAQNEPLLFNDENETMIKNDICKNSEFKSIAKENLMNTDTEVNINTVTLSDNAYSETVYISTSEDLLAIDGHSGGYYELMCDISISSRKWTPLKLYNATFNGNGHKISGMKISEKSNSQTTGFISGSENYITNLTLDNFDINITDSFTGTNDGKPNYVIPAGDAYAYNCKFKGDVNITTTLDDQYLAVFGIYGGSKNEFFGNMSLNRNNDATSVVDLYGLGNCSNSTFTGNIEAKGKNATAGAIYADDFETVTENCRFKGNVYCGDLSEVSAFLASGSGKIKGCSFYGNVIENCTDEYFYTDAYGFYAFYGTIQDSVLYGNLHGDEGFRSHGGRIDNCRMVGDVCSVGYYDGLATLSDGSYGMTAVMGGIINSCVLQGNISGMGDVCGIGVNYGYGSNEENGKITNSSVYGDISASDPCYEIYGINSSKATTVSNCSVYGDVRSVENKNYTSSDCYGIYGGYNNRLNGDVIIYGDGCGIYEAGGIGSSNVINGKVRRIIDGVTITADKSTPLVKLFTCDSCKSNFIGTERTYWVQCPFCEQKNYKLNGNYYLCKENCIKCKNYWDDVIKDYEEVGSNDYMSDPLFQSKYCLVCDCATCDYCNPPLSVPDSEPVGGNRDAGNIVAYRIGDGASGSGSVYVPPVADEPKEESFAIKIVESISEAPVSGAVIIADGNEYTTNTDGIAFLKQKSCIEYLTVSIGEQLVYSESNFCAAPGYVNEIQVNGLELTSENFNFSINASADVKGPEIEIAGKSVPIMALPLGFEFNIGDYSSVSYDETDNTYKVIIGSEEFAKSSDMTPEWRQQYNKLQNLLSKKDITENEIFNAMNGKKL